MVQTDVAGDLGQVDADRAGRLVDLDGQVEVFEIRANRASELITETLVLSRQATGRNRPFCKVVKAIRVPSDVRQLLDAPSYVHLSTLRADGSPRNWVVWVGLEDDYILVYTSDAIWKAKDMRRNLGAPCRSPTWPTRTAWPRSRPRDRGTPGRGLPVPDPISSSTPARRSPSP
jgi:hypothetical protein